VELTGSSLTSGVLTGIIEQAERTVTAYLEVAGLSLPSSNEVLKGAVLKLSVADVYNREILGGESAESVKIGELSMENRSGSTLVKTLKDEAITIINLYIQAQLKSQYRDMVYKVNG